MRFLAYLVCYCIYPFSFLFPRNKKKWAFEHQQNDRGRGEEQGHEGILDS